MKRWAIRLSALAAVVALGYVTVTWAQRRFAAGDGLPDVSQTPVNAEAAASLAAQSHSGSTSGEGARTPVDPFQRLPGATNSAEHANHLAPPADRYGSAEPQPLDADPSAEPLSSRTNPSRPNALRDDFPSPTAAGMPDVPTSNSGNNAADPSAPVDPFALQRGGSSVPVEVAGGDAYSADPSRVIPAAGGAVPTGNLEPAQAATPDHVNPSMDQRLAAPLSAGADRYGNTLLPESRRPAALDAAPSIADGPRGFPASNAANNENLLQPLGAAAAGVGIGSALDGNIATGGLPNGGSLGASTAAASLNTEGMAKPGDKKLEGAQSPSVTIEKIAPPEIQVGKPAQFNIVVRNTGPVVAENVEVVDAVPQGTQLVGTSPQAAVGPRGEVTWKLGDLKPGDEAKLQIDLMPLAEGEIGSVAVVQFRSAASVRTIATKPELALELAAPSQVMIGSDAKVTIKLSNPGTGVANKVVLQEQVPPGFQHAAGAELEFEVGDLKPGESRELELTLRAVQAGKFANTLVVTGDANLRTEKSVPIEVIAPALEVAVAGPGLRYLERQASYTVSVSNPGTAAAKEVQLVTRLPKGMQFVKASDSGQYDQASHSVLWSLEELPAGESGSVTLTTLAQEAGEQKLLGEGRAAGGLNDTTEQTTMVEGVAAVLFTVVDVDDPVEVGGQATYEIQVSNQGSKAASRVQVAALLPPEMKPVNAEGPARHTIEGQRVVFEPLARLAPKADITYRVMAQGLAPGDLRIKVQLLTDEMAQPVTKEEGTRVYKD